MRRRFIEFNVRSCRTMPRSWATNRFLTRHVSSSTTFSSASIDMYARYIAFDSALAAGNSTTGTPPYPSKLIFNEHTRSIDDLFTVYSRTPHLRARVIQDLFDNVQKEDFLSVSAILHDIFRVNSVTGHAATFLEYFATHKDLLDSNALATILSNIILLQSAFFGDALLASSYYLEIINTSKSIEIKPETVCTILASLARQRDSISFFCSVAIIRIVTPSVLRDLPPPLIILLLRFCSRSFHTTYHANVIYQRLGITGQTAEWTDDDLMAFKDAIRPLISHNLRMHSFERAFSIWKLTVNEECTESDIDAVCEILTNAPEDFDLEEIVSLIPHQAMKDCKVVDTLLQLYGANQSYTTQFSLLVGSLNAPLKKLTLSLLFTAYMKQGNEVIAEKILETILKSDKGITSHDLGVIVSKLLESGKIDQSISVCTKSDISVSKLAYIKVFEEITLRDAVTMKKYWSFLVQLCTRFKGLSDDREIYDQLTLALLKYLLARFGLLPAKNQYMKISRHVSAYNVMGRSLHELVANLEQFGIPNQFAHVLALNAKTKLQLLEEFAHSSLLQNDFPIFYWAFDEMRALGIQLPELIRRFSVKANIREKFEECVNPEYLDLTRNYEKLSMHE